LTPAVSGGYPCVSEGHGDQFIEMIAAFAAIETPDQAR
jgi:hypothetical protein